MPTFPILLALSASHALNDLLQSVITAVYPMLKADLDLDFAQIGIITLVIRLWGAYPEGMSFAILIMNGVTPLINRYMKPRKFGERRAAA